MKLLNSELNNGMRLRIARGSLCPRAKVVEEKKNENYLIESINSF